MGNLLDDLGDLMTTDWRRIRAAPANSVRLRYASKQGGGGLAEYPETQCHHA